MTFALTIGILFTAGLSRNRWPFLAAAAVIMIASIILTGSRGGMIGLFASIVSVGVFSALQKAGDRSTDRALSPAAVMGAGFALMMLTVVFVVFLGGTDPLLRSAGVSSGVGDFTSGRMEFWQTAIRIFLSHPIIGVGLDGFGAAYSIYDLSSGAFRIEQAHNDYLQILADAGLLGFSCVAGFIFLLMRDGITRIREASSGFRRGAAIGALAGCIGILVHSFFDFPLRTPANAFVFLMLAAIATVSIPEEPPRPSRRRRSSSMDRISEPSR
jgi:O-antigen ligase